MTEHRGALLAVGVAFLTFAAALVTAYAVTNYSEGKEFDWVSGFSQVGGVLALMGVAFVVAAVALTERVKWKIRKLNEITGTGNALMDQLEVSLTGIASAVPIVELNQQIVNYGQDVDKWLWKCLPQYSKYFRNRGGHVKLMWEEVPEAVDLNDDTATYTVCMSMLSGHLRRLAEITMKL